MNKKILKPILITLLSSSILTSSLPAFADEVNKNIIEHTDNISLTDYNENEIVNIPDENLKRALNIQLGKSEDSDLTKGQLRLITELDISNSNISSLKGLEYCGNLITLNISHNNVVDISPLEGLTGIVDLNLSYNRITDITPLEGLKNLVNIDTTANAVGNLNILDGLLNFDFDADYYKTTDISFSTDFDSLFDINSSSNSNINFDFSSNLENISTGNNNEGNGGNISDLFDNLDIGKLFGNNNNSNSGSLNNLGSGSTSLENKSALSSSSFSTNSSSITKTNDNQSLSGIITLVILAITSIISLVLNRKKEIIE